MVLLLSILAGVTINLLLMRYRRGRAQFWLASWRRDAYEPAGWRLFRLQYAVLIAGGAVTLMLWVAAGLFC